MSATLILVALCTLRGLSQLLRGQGLAQEETPCPRAVAVCVDAGTLGATLYSKVGD